MREYGTATTLDLVMGALMENGIDVQADSFLYARIESIFNSIRPGNLITLDTALVDVLTGQEMRKEGYLPDATFLSEVSYCMSERTAEQRTDQILEAVDASYRIRETLNRIEEEQS